jgi:transcriptional regulator with GAF, ATPase, and Fis domain
VILESGNEITPASLPDFEVESRLREGRGAGGLRRPLSPGEPGISLSDALVRFEREMIQSALSKTGGNLESAAGELGLPVSNLKYKMSRLDLPLDGAVDGGSI